MLQRWLFVLAMMALLQCSALSQDPPTEHQAIRDGYCRSAEMPTSWKTSVTPVAIERSRAVFDNLGVSWPDLNVRNTQAKAITNIVFILEYFDKNGRRVETAPLGAAASGYEKLSLTPFPIDNLHAWQEPLAPGNTAFVGGVHNGNRPTSCQLAAQITFVLIRYIDGTTQQYASKGWFVPPVPRHVPELHVPCPIVPTDFTEFEGNLQLDSAGRVLGVLSDSAPTYYATELRWVTEQLKRWTFHPALVDGKPSSIDLPGEFVLYDRNSPLSTGNAPTSPAVLIRFRPSDDLSRCIESLGLLDENSGIP